MNWLVSRSSRFRLVRLMKQAMTDDPGFFGCHLHRQSDPRRQTKRCVFIAEANHHAPVRADAENQIARRQNEPLFFVGHGRLPMTERPNTVSGLQAKRAEQVKLRDQLEADIRAKADTSWRQPGSLVETSHDACPRRRRQRRPDDASARGRQRRVIGVEGQL